MSKNKVPSLTLGESKALPPLKIITIKSVGTYIAKNKSVSTAGEEVKEKSVVEKGVTAAKRRPALAVEPVAKKKRTTVWRAAPTVKDLSIVPVVQEAVPITMVSVGNPTVQISKAPKRKSILQEETKEEDIDSKDTEPLSKGVMTKWGKIVVVVRSLKIEGYREVVGAAVNHLRKEVDHTKKGGAEVLDLVVGFCDANTIDGVELIE
ncbi:hypothetical protein F511_11095 [Dorcoceras hygrometricum]|uniref:Uncharacterized protein n=1 Tax=Dorcoceras hygrometricum TaxID=472368 RepID=A0A2Z7BIG0_9LAMI|nr:hypothetical protein F511_11095 [Dorcoceras hygrometricum]